MSAFTDIVLLLVASKVKPSTVVVDEIVPRLLKLLFLKFQEIVSEAETIKLLEPANVASVTISVNNAAKALFILLFNIKPPVKFNAKS